VSLRLGGPEAVHDARVAARRLRSTLRTFSEVLVPETASALGEELRWFADSLGDARDSQVMFALLHEAVTTLPAADTTELTAALVVWATEMHAGAAPGAVLDEPRYADLVAQLASLAVAPPFTGPADAVATRALPELLRPAVHSFRSRVTTAVTEGSMPADYHRARIAGKRLRYAAEVSSPVYGRAAARYIDTLTSLQDSLGRHHDTTVAIGALHERAAASSAADAFLFGALRLRLIDDLAAQERVLRKWWAKRADLVRLAELTNGE